jgi:hypothetical protein
MKLLSLLFAFYFFALALFPCADKVERDKFEKQEISENSNHADHEHTSEMCSPLCLCVCCGIQLVFTAKLESIPYSNSKDIKKTFYVSRIFSNYLSEIWKPPKFVNV